MRTDAGVLLQLAVAAFRTEGRIGLVMAALIYFGAQIGPPGPPRAPGPDPANRVAEIRRKLETTRAVDVTARRALDYSRSFLGSAETALRSGHSFVADRMAEAADSLLHVAEHQGHLHEGGGPKGPPPPPSIQDHLQRVYFRTQQADYFFQLSKDGRAQSFAKWARDFYQLAVRAYERKDWIAADENAKCAEEIVKALENLAQAATPPSTPPPPQPPRGPR